MLADRGLTHLRRFGRMVKFEHTLFALPFALAAAAIAARGHGLSAMRLLGIVVAMAAARTAAMGFNRIVDRHIDARNPRTAGREIPTGVVSLRAAWTLTSIAVVAFVAAAAALGPLCLALAPVALALLLGYSFTKRFTALCHLFLRLDAPPARPAPGIAVHQGSPGIHRPPRDRGRLWIAGSTSSTRLAVATSAGRPVSHSIRRGSECGGVSNLGPAARHDRLGAHRARQSPPLRPPLAGVVVVVVLLVYEHAIVRLGDLSRLNIAFFNLNGYVSVAFFVATLMDVLWR